MKAQTPDIFIYFLEYQHLKDLEGNNEDGGGGSKEKEKVEEIIDNPPPIPAMTTPLSH